VRRDNRRRSQNSDGLARRPRSSPVTDFGSSARIGRRSRRFSRRVRTRRTGFGRPESGHDEVSAEVAKLVTAKLECPVKLLNDARAATLGELRYGLGKDIDSMAMLTLGTGVGGGIAVDGKLVLGPLGAAGELGHQRIMPDGPICGCGQRGCLETLVSGPAFTGEAVRLLKAGLAPGLHKLVDGDIGKVSPREMAQAAREGDEVLAQSIKRRAGYLGIGVANVVTILHPDLVVLTGGVAEMGDILIDPVRTAARKHVGMFPTENVQVEKSVLGEKAGLLGTIALAAESLSNQ